VDYSAIEARVLAWLAGESWALEAFYNGRDIYVETAQHMGGGMTRYDGKIATLALGYNGGVGSLRAMGAEGTDAHLQKIVTAWRDTSPAIVGMWKDMEQAFYAGGSVGRIEVVKTDKDRALVLPSGRALQYRGCKWDWEETPYGPRRRASFKNPQGGRAYTYGGRLCENVTQAVARDILAEALVRLEDSGYAVVAHVHDEAVLDGAPPVEDIVKIMCELPSWAAGRPIDAEGFTTERYRKG
jgi:DNA polymerase